MDSNRILNYSKIFDNMIDIVLIIAETGKLIYGNKSALEFYGYTIEELTNCNIYDIRYEEDKEYIRKQLKQAMSQGIEFEALHRKKSGEIVSVKVRSVFIEDSIKDCVISIIQDMTKVSRLAEKAKMFDISLDISEEAIIVVDVSFCVSIWNKAAEKRFGFKKEELIGNSIDVLIPEEKTEELLVIIELIKMGEVIDRIETTRYHKDGHLIEVSVAYSPLYNQQSEIIGAIAIYSDISEIKLARMRAIENQERAVLALEGGKFYIWDIDLKHKNIVIFSNIEILLGCQEDDIGGDVEKWLTYIHPDDLFLINDIFNQHVTQQKEFIVEYRIITKSNGYRWIRSKGKVIAYDEHNNPVRLLGTNEDITERKEFEQALIEKNKVLERLLEEAKQEDIIARISQIRKGVRT